LMPVSVKEIFSTLTANRISQKPIRFLPDL
jgi:hypothetical protein